jgi:hypothetical protein
LIVSNYLSIETYGVQVMNETDKSVDIDLMDLTQQELLQRINERYDYLCKQQQEDIGAPESSSIDIEEKEYFQNTNLPQG